MIDAPKSNEVLEGMCMPRSNLLGIVVDSEPWGALTGKLIDLYHKPRIVSRQHECKSIVDATCRKDSGD